MTVDAILLLNHKKVKNVRKNFKQYLKLNWHHKHNEKIIKHESDTGVQMPHLMWLFISLVMSVLSCIQTLQKPHQAADYRSCTHMLASKTSSVNVRTCLNLKLVELGTWLSHSAPRSNAFPLLLYLRLLTYHPDFQHSWTPIKFQKV